MEKFNKDNLADYNIRTDEDFRRQRDLDIIWDRINNTDWKKESDYFNSYHRKNKGNAIRMNNKQYLKLNNLT